MSPPIPEAIGRYRVVRYLGSGGMGTLYVAQDPAIDRQVAIKLLKDGYDTPELRERFTREARSAGRLRHPHVVTIFDVGEHNGCPFIAMEFVEGATLDMVIRRQQPLALDRKIEIMDDLLSALQYAHKNGVIHRDIKPANLMLDVDGRLKVLDFGIARLDTSGMTQAGVVMGTLNYVSPEQLRGEQIDGRADLFSAGAVFYELLTYRRAFPGDLHTGILHKILNGQPEPLGSIVTGIDPSLVGFVDRCLEKAADRRYPDLVTARAELSTIKWRVRHMASAVTHMPIASAADVPGSPTPTPRPRREELLRIRAEQFEGHLSEARRAFEGGAHQAALEACQRALVLEPESSTALALEDRVRRAMEDHQISAWLAEARSGLERGALTSASLLIERALSLNSSSPDALALRQAVDGARRKLAEDQARSRQFEETVRKSRQFLQAGDLASASKAVADALTIDSRHSGALSLKREIDQAAALEAGAARAREVVADAERRFASGRRREAIALLEATVPSHALITGALENLRLEHQQLERMAETHRAPRPVSVAPPVAAPIPVRPINQPPRPADAPPPLTVAPVPRIAETQAPSTPTPPPIAAPPISTPVSALADVALARSSRASDGGQGPQPLADDEPARTPASVRSAALTTSRPAFGGPMALLAVAALVAAFGGGLWWMLTRPEQAPPAVTMPSAGSEQPTPASANPTAVAVNVIPWARLTSAVDMATNQRIDLDGAVTPVVLSLAPGTYRVTATNPNVPSPIEFDVTVTAEGPTREIRHLVPGFNADAEIERVLAER